MQRLKNYLRPFLSWRFLICFFLSWFVTNGWSYIFIIIGLLCGIDWMFDVGAGWQAFLWLPCTPEKLVTIPMAMWFNFKLFKDAKTEAHLKTMLEQARYDWDKVRWRRHMREMEIIGLVELWYSSKVRSPLTQHAWSYLERRKFIKDGKPTYKLYALLSRHNIHIKGVNV